MTMVPIIVGLVAVLAAGLYLALRWRYSTWKRKGVPGPRPIIFNIPKVLLGQENVGDIADRLYKDYRDAPLVGTYMFTTPVLHIHEPEIIKQVFIKEFQDFHSRGVSSHLDYDPLSNHLFFQSGSRWKNMRVKLAPTFTSGKIKYMFEAIRTGATQLNDYLGEEVAAGGGVYMEDARDLMLRLFVDTISSVAFGITTNVVRNPGSDFHKAALKSVAPSNNLRFLLAIFVTEILSTFRIRSTNTDTTNFFKKVVRETIEYREKNNVSRADMLNLLMQLKNQGFVAPDTGERENKDASNMAEKLTMDEVAAQVFIFFVAGFESSAGTTSFTLYEMAKNPEVAEKILREVDQVMQKFNGQISYEAIMSMPYLDKAISETLRKYPPLNFLTREAMVTRKMPLSDVVVEKGTRLIIPVRALHYDPHYWPEPETYDPERFSEEHKHSRPAHAYLPFGDGPRICIANRLGLVQVKTALLTVLSKYTVSTCPSTPNKVIVSPTSFATTPLEPLSLNFHLRKVA